MKFLKQAQLKHKYVGAFLILGLIVAVTGMSGILINSMVGKRVQTTLKNSSTQERFVLQMEIQLKSAHVLLLEASKVRGDRARFDDMVEDYRSKSEAILKYCDYLLKGNDKLNLLPAEPGSDVEKQIIVVKTSVNSFSILAERLVARKSSVLGSGATLTDAELSDLSGEKLNDAAESVKLAVDDLLVAVGNLTTAAHQEVQLIQNLATVIFFAVTIGALLLSILMGIFMTRHMVTRINVMAQAVNQGAAGDLTASIQIESADELGGLARDFNFMVEGLATMLGKVNSTTRELNNVASSIYSASRQMIDATELQARGVQVTSSSVNQISNSVSHVAKAMDYLSASASESSSSALEMAANVEEVALHVDSLAQSVDGVSSSIIEMATSIRQIGSSIQSLMESSTMTASSVAEMDSSIRQVEKNATQTAAISEQVQHDAEQGKSSVDATIVGMMEIRRSSLITSEVITSLSSRAHDIGAILQVIDEVAKQTNLLALNAAIIAAQAGEHGKGFAVVADEIKGLADRTTSSTREIVRLIEGVQEETKRAVQAIDQAEQRIAEGEILSQNSGDALKKIVNGVQQATVQVGQIARAAVEQAKGSKIIREAMEQVSQMVHQIANATREQTSGSEQIMAAVEDMKRLTGQVRNSTKEQAKAGSLIARSTEQITGIIHEVKEASDEQSRDSIQIVEAVKDIERSTSVNVQSAKVMDDVVSSLSQQIDLLRREMGNFKVERE